MTINSPDAMPDDDPQVPPTEGSDSSKGSDGDVPEGQEGVGIGATEEPNTFEPEEDPEASDPEAEGQQ